MLPYYIVNHREKADGKKTFWHSSAHLLAEALEALYPGIQLGIGPPIANGFYYDIDFGDSTQVQVEKTNRKPSNNTLSVESPLQNYPRRGYMKKTKKGI
jgi:threonyl-tRNA synthetase